MGRPAKSKSEKYRSLTISVRPEDADVLQHLSLDQFMRKMEGEGGPAEAHRMIFERGERPSVSAAIRYLIDAERERRLAPLLAAWKKTHPKKPAPAADVLLAGDFVFGKRR